MKKPIRVLLVEDDEADSELIIAELDRAGLDTTTQRVDSKERFTSALRDFAPDVVLCDSGLGPFSAKAAIEIVRLTRPAVALIVVTGNTDQRITVESVRNGAEDVIHKSDLSRLPGAINSALAARRRLEKLTPRQLQVLRLVAEGLSTPEIAQRLQLSTKTIETHRTELMKRLGFHDVVTLVRYAIRVGIVGSEL